jgi:hypothetical protein
VRTDFGEEALAAYDKLVEFAREMREDLIREQAEADDRPL